MLNKPETLGNVFFKIFRPIFSLIAYTISDRFSVKIISNIIHIYICIHFFFFPVSCTHCRLPVWRWSLLLCSSTETWCFPSGPDTTWFAAVNFPCDWTWWSREKKNGGDDLFEKLSDRKKFRNKKKKKKITKSTSNFFDPKGASCLRVFSLLSTAVWRFHGGQK